MASKQTFIGYPAPRAISKVPYKAKTESNPVLSGSLLKIAASICSNFPFVQAVFWKNAGFDGLRDLDILSEYSPRFDPTVIPTGHTSAVDLIQQHAPSSGGFPQGTYVSVNEYHDLFESGRVTPTEVVHHLLPLIRRDIGQRHPHSVAFIDTNVKLVLEAAEASTQRYKAGRSLSILDGVPVAVKDEANVIGYRTTKGGKLDEQHMSLQKETEWPIKMWQDAGAVLIGKLNMHELGTDVTNNNPSWGTPRNPYNSRYYTGGSSGGSGYAVAAGLVPIALGADGGGSIRIPSSYCGVYGLKPTHGRIGDTASSVTVLGPLASSIADLEIAYNMMAQPNPDHPVCSLFSTASVDKTHSSNSKVIGICEEWFDRADTEVQKMCRAALDHLVQNENYDLIYIDLPYLYEGQKAHAMTILSEMSSSAQLEAPPQTSWLSSLSAANKILLSVATQTPASDYILGARLRHLHMAHLAHLYRKYPGLIIVTPASPIAGYAIRDEADLVSGVSDGNGTIRAMEYVWMANWTGCPAISCPVGYSKAARGGGPLPVGLMGMGEWGNEAELIGFGGRLEDYLGSDRMQPPIWEDVLGSLGTRG